MRFGKRLAIAIATESELRPFTRQKYLKRLLVGLEKLSRAWESQISPEDATAVALANLERAKVGVPLCADRALDESEVREQDRVFLAALAEDVDTLSAFVLATENYIAVAINGWLRDALALGLVFRSLGRTTFSSPESDRRLLDLVLLKRIQDRHFVQGCAHLASTLLPISDAVDSINQHVDLNIAAINKLLNRRAQHIPLSLRAPADLLPAVETRLRSSRSVLIANSLEQMRHAIEDVYERTVLDRLSPPSLLIDSGLSPSLKLPSASTSANSPTGTHTTSPNKACAHGLSVQPPCPSA